tara:strand:+ start:886 stop:2460 length:1575 start_codon:yes stop_codon:yes gene_type:complete
MTKENPVHWADVVVKRVIAEKGNKKKYVCAAGITPSGTIHIGNFREIITVDFVARAFKHAGKNVRFIYSWDNFDVFRKVPAGMPKQVMLKKNLRKAIVDIEDPFGTEESYARHHEVEVEQDISKVGIFPEFLYQAKKYRAGEYAEGIKTALKNVGKIKEILDEYRKEALAKSWLPIAGYCPDCNKDEVSFSNYDGKYKIDLSCKSCKSKTTIDIRKSKNIKLLWRVDWPMRWAYEKVDFEPGGKDHSTLGGSFSTGKEIVKLYKWTAPTYQRYDFIGVKGIGGKISSSKGNVITLGNCLEIYEPEIVRYLFASTRPNAEFSISFDLDVLKIYEDFDKTERIYFGKEEVNVKKREKNKRIYELSAVDKLPKKLPIQPSFRHISNILQTHSMDIESTIKFFKKEIKNKTDEKRVRARTTCVKNWLENYAPKEFKFSLQDKKPKTLKLSKAMKLALKSFAKRLKSKDWSDKELHEFFYEHMRENNVEPKDAFKACYNILINKDKGPQLASFILIIGKAKVAKLLESV